MKYIVKGPEPVLFTNWKNQANEDWTPLYSDLRGDEKAALLESLKREQGYICCYCERDFDTNDCHVEHLKPQGKSLFPQNQLDYDNLLCSCQFELEKGEPRHCGNSKGEWYNEQLLVSPLSEGCELKFKYTYDGYIQPSNSDDNASITTIDKLKLDIDKLNVLRKNAIEPFLDQELSIADLRNFVDGYLVDKDENGGRFNQFYTTIKYLFT